MNFLFIFFGVSSYNTAVGGGGGGVTLLLLKAFFLSESLGNIGELLGFS